MTWPTAKLKDVALIQMGQSPPGHTYNDQGEGLPFFQGKADFGPRYPNVRMWCSSPNRIAENGDILLSVRAPVGPTNVADRQCCVGRGLAAIRSLAPKAVLPDYIRYIFKWVEPGLSQKGQGSTFAAINRKDVENIQFPLPTLSEQQRIVEILDHADALRQQRRAADEKAQRVLPAIFHSMFGDPLQNTKNWHLRRFDEVARSRLGKMLDAKQQTGEHRRPYMRNANVQWNRFDLRDVLEMDFAPAERGEFLLKSGDLLICEGGEVGRCAIWRDELPECYFQKALHRARPIEGEATSEYLMYLFWMLALRGGLSDSTSQVTIAHLTGVKLKQMMIPVPPYPLQEEFSSLVRAVDRPFRDRRNCGHRLERLFDVLLHRAFTGELTAGWREAHKEQLETEMQEQIAALEEARTAQPKRGRKATTSRSGGTVGGRNAGHDMFNKAALVTYIVTKCHDPQRPLGRTKLAKLFYLVQRRAEISLTEQFARRAAGPLDDAIPKVLNLAKKNGWVALAKAQGKLKPVVPGDNPQPAIDHVRERWADAVASIDEVLDKMKGWGWEALERWATVENAAQQLADDGKPATLAAIKEVIAAEPKWRPKLDRDAFSDLNIQRTLKGLRDHGYLPAEAGANH